MAENPDPLFFVRNGLDIPQREHTRVVFSVQLPRVLC
jgi:hypothetical protein